VDIEPPGRLTVDQDNLEGRARVELAIPPVLRVELHAQEGLGLRLVPRDGRKLLRARAPVDALKELAVALLHREKVDHQPRGGKTPCSAMQK